MHINGIPIDDTFAEAFDMKATRLLITAIDPRWARQAGQTMCGYATSVIGCGVEASIERELPAQQTPDGRPGVAVLLFGMSSKELAKQVENRAGQCVLTCPTTALYNGLDSEQHMPLGKNLRYFGDGWQISKQLAGRRYWRVPVMDGEFVIEESAGYGAAVGGGNFLLLADKQQNALRACEQAVAAIADIEGVITPFPGGIVRSGSKVGSRYPKLMASTNHAFCPALRGLVDSRLDDDCNAVLEIVINGLTAEQVGHAMTAGIRAACAGGPDSGVRRISAGNYGGKLGRHHFKLHPLLEETC